MAALLVIGVGSGYFYTSSDPNAQRGLSDVNGYLGFDGGNPQRGSGLEHVIESLLPEGQALTRNEFFLLRWKGPTDASYDLTLMTEDLTLVVAQAADLVEAEYLVAAEDLEELASGTQLLWRIEARLDNGQKLVSPTLRALLE